MRTAFLSAIVALTLSAQTAQAGWVDDWLQQHAGSTPNYFSGQQRGYYSGGSFSGRWHSTAEYPVTVEVPRIKGGCGAYWAVFGAFTAAHAWFAVGFPSLRAREISSRALEARGFPSAWKIQSSTRAFRASSGLVVLVSGSAGFGTRGAPGWTVEIDGNGTLYFARSGSGGQSPDAVPLPARRAASLGQTPTKPEDGRSMPAMRQRAFVLGSYTVTPVSAARKATRIRRSSKRSSRSPTRPTGDPNRTTSWLRYATLAIWMSRGWSARSTPG